MANKHLQGQGLVLALTSSCMTTWYQMVNKFSSRPEVYDVAPGKFHEKYNIIKMNPGVDVRDETYQFLQDTTTKLSKTLNKLFNRDIFIPRINRGPDTLETLVAFKEARGGVFQVKGSMNEGSASIFLTMPNEEQLQKAFSAMTGTPHPEDMIDEPDAVPEVEPVAGDAIPEVEPEIDVEPEVGVEDPMADPLADEEPIEDARRFGEGFRAYVAESSNEVFKVVYKENGITKEEIVKNEQQANQIARRKKGKVVSQQSENLGAAAKLAMAVTGQDEVMEDDELVTYRQRADGKYTPVKPGEGPAKRAPGEKIPPRPKNMNENGDRFVVKGIYKSDGEENIIHTNSIGRFAQVYYKNNQIGMYRSVTLYDNGEAVLHWDNPNLPKTENVSVGQAMGTATQPAVYEPNGHNGFTGGPFGGKPKRRN